MTRLAHHRIFTDSLTGMAAMLVMLEISISASAAISNGPNYTNAVTAEEQRILQFHLAEQAFQQKLKVGRERYDQKQINRAKVIAAMSSELQARRQTVVMQPVAGAASSGDTDEPASWFQPWVAVAVLAVGFIGFAYYLNRRRLQDLFGQKQQVIVVPAPQAVGNSKAEEIFFCEGSGTDGRGRYSHEGFVVLKGSVGRKEDAQSTAGKAGAFRAKLFELGVMLEEGDTVIFEKDHLFHTPSMAAIVLMGREANGWLEWKTKDGKALDTVQRLEPRESVIVNYLIKTCDTLS